MSEKIKWFLAAILVSGGSAILILLSFSAQAQIEIWQVPVQISDTDGNSGGPHLVADLQNSVHLIWSDWIDLASHPPYLQYSSRGSTGEWSEPEFIRELGWPIKGYFGDNVGVVLGPDGGLHMVWEHYRYDDGEDSITYIRRNADGTWSTVEEVPHQKEWPAASQPDIGVSPDGTVHVVYQDWLGPGTQKTIQHVMRLPSGAWTSTVQVTQVEGDYLHPMLAVDDEGTAHLIYTKKTDDQNEFFSASKKPVENWTGPINMNVSPTSENSVEQLTSGAGGRLHLVWTEWDQSVFPWNCSVMYSGKVRSGGWSAPRSLAHHCATQVAVGADRFGRAHVVWHYDGQLWYTYQNPEGAFTNSSIAEDTDPYHQYPVDLSIAVDSQGGRHVSWNSNHDGNIWATSISGALAVTEVITQGGGTLYAFSGDTQVEFPAWAVSEDTLVSFTPQKATAPAGMVILSAFDLTAENVSDGMPVTSFSEPYTITSYYTDAEISSVKENTLGFYWWNNGAWEKVSTSVVDAVSNKVSASLDHMTQFAVLGEGGETIYYLNLPLVTRGISP